MGESGILNSVACKAMKLIKINCLVSFGVDTIFIQLFIFCVPFSNSFLLTQVNDSEVLIKLYYKLLLKSNLGQNGEK